MSSRPEVAAERSRSNLRAPIARPVVSYAASSGSLDPLVQALHELAVAAVRWRGGELEAAAFAALYFLGWQLARHGAQACAARKRRGDPRPDAAAWRPALLLACVDPETLRARLLDILDRYQFRGVSANVPVALCRWLRGAWRIELREDVPSARELLRAQARGARYVTALTAIPRALEPVLRHADAYAFFLHDLEHADKFFCSPELHADQRAFFSAFDAALDRGVFDVYLDRAAFVEKLDYVMSDMNTHPEHSRQYLRAILVEAHLAHEGKPADAALSPAAERAIEDVMRNFPRSLDDGF